jgi:dipeptide/tripeptide permease
VVIFYKNKNMQFTNLNIYSFSIFFLIFGLIIFLLIKKNNKRKKIEKKYKNLFENNKKNFLAEIFLAISLIILLFSIFAIKISTKKNINNTKGLDIVFVLDVSKSMNTIDID